MSHGSCVAARDGDPAPLATRPPRASVAAAANVSSARLVCRNRGLTDIVDLPFLMRTGLPFCSAAGRSFAGMGNSAKGVLAR